MSPHPDPLVLAALNSWKGAPADMVIHMGDERDGAPVPPSGSGKKMRNQAAVLLRELSQRSKASPVLYRGSHLPPRGYQSWTTSRSVAERWAAKNHGRVFELPAGSLGLRIADYLNADPEREWIASPEHTPNARRAERSPAHLQQPTEEALMKKLTRKAAHDAYGIWLLEQRLHGKRNVRAILHGVPLAESVDVARCLRQLEHHGRIAAGLGESLQTLSRAREHEPNGHTALESDVARYIAGAAQPTTREIATTIGWSLKRTRELLFLMAERDFPPYGMLAYNDIGSAASGQRPGRQSPNEYVWFFT